ncbi:MAG: twin-arginine translocation signal domain-containing protein [Thermoguttaceae bacterium]|nr:twin-arginine translocation signal domain-containing protein [Thermoguttaceae bacterium]
MKDDSLSRRDLLKKITAASLAAGAGSSAVSYHSHEERILAEEGKNAASGAADAVSGATRLSFHPQQTEELKEKVPLTKLGNAVVSRVILGGNLIGGYAHARDLIYVSDLIRAYHTEQKCIETFMIAEEAGINTFLGDWNMHQMMSNYWKWTDGKMQLITQCPDSMDEVKKAIDTGAIAIYPTGEVSERRVAQGDYSFYEPFFKLVRDAGLPAGLGAHRIETIRALADRGLIPDFWMKTFHPVNYWSARHPEEHDNIYCRKPKETAEFFADRPEPWIAFKTLAAGAVAPQEGFRFAMEGGADFICVGMYDFQIFKDANIFTDIMNGGINRKRRMLDPVDRADYEAQLEEEEA